MTDNRNAATINELSSTLWSMRQVFLSTGIFSFAINLLMLVPTLYMLQIYDRILNSRNTMTLLFITLLTLALYLLLGAIEWVRSELLIRAGIRFDNRLKHRAFNASFEARLRGVADNPTQSLNDLTNIRQFMTAQGIFAFFDAPWTPIYLGVIFLLHPVMGLTCLGGVILMTLLTLLTEFLTRKPLHQANTAATQAHNFVDTNLRNAEVIEAMGMLDDLRKRWQKKHSASLVLQQIASDRASVISALTRTIRVAQQSIVLAVGALLVIDGKITPGAMIAASILIGRTMSPIEQVIGAWKGLLSARAAYGRLKSLLQTFPLRPASMPLPPPNGLLQVEQAATLAPNRQAILRNINFTLNPGEALGVIGPSASGKSTLARLLVGILPAAAGSVRLDSADVFTWNKLELGQHIGYLPQDIELFEGTIAENIARFSEVNPRHVVAAAQRAGIHEMILRMPQGYGTRIGEGGGFLSGGQRQRIALARAIYGNPKLIVLDEPNSNLDDFGEQALLKTLLDLKAAGSTIIVISHRSGIIGAVDKLLVLKEGQQAVFGPRNEVLNALARAAPTANNVHPMPASATKTP